MQSKPYLSGFSLGYPARFYKMLCRYVGYISPLLLLLMSGSVHAAPFSVLTQPGAYWSYQVVAAPASPDILKSGIEEWIKKQKPLTGVPPIQLRVAEVKAIAEFKYVVLVPALIGADGKAVSANAEQQKQLEVLLQPIYLAIGPDGIEQLADANAQLETLRRPPGVWLGAFTFPSVVHHLKLGEMEYRTEDQYADTKVVFENQISNFRIGAKSVELWTMSRNHQKVYKTITKPKDGNDVYEPLDLVSFSPVVGPILLCSSSQLGRICLRIDAKSARMPGADGISDSSQDGSSAAFFLRTDVAILTPVACYDAKINQLRAEDACLAILPKGQSAKVKMSDGSYYRLGEMSHQSCEESGGGAASAMFYIQPNANSKSMAGVWSNKGAPTITIAKQLSPLLTPQQQVQLNDTVRHMIPELEKDVKVSRIVALDVDRDGLDDFVYSVRLKRNKRDNTLFSGLLLKRGAAPEQISVLASCGVYGVEWELRGSVDLDGDGHHELWIKKQSQDGVIEGLYFFGKKGATEIGIWANCSS